MSGRVRVAPILALALATFGCATSSPGPAGSPFEVLPTLGVHMPDDADREARQVAAAALHTDDTALDEAIVRLEAVEAVRRDASEPPTGILPYALEMRSAFTATEHQRVERLEDLLDRDDLDPAQRARLELEVADHPLKLARARIRDARVTRFGGMVNALVEPLGKSIFNTTMLPLRAAQGLLAMVLFQHSQPELNLQERQALAHWKRFIEKHPQAPESAELVERVEKAQIRWYETQRDRTLHEGRRALEVGDAEAAALFAQRALRFRPEDRGALGLLKDADELRALQRQELSWSLGASAEPADLSDAAGRDLALALLLPDGGVEAEAERLREADPEGPLADEAAFAVALAAGERGAEKEMWSLLESLADRDGEGSNMARHAAALVHDTDLNPYRSFRLARRAELLDRMRWLLLGPLAQSPPDRGLPRPLEWGMQLIKLPRVAIGLPNRLLRFPFMDPKRRSPGVYGRRYLTRHPEGERAEEVREWLVERERESGNYLGALQLAEGSSEADPEQLDELHEKAAEQALEGASRQRSLAFRIPLLRRVAREFPETEAGHAAGNQVRALAEQVTPQSIRISRGFLEENRRIVGTEGLALRPELLDDDLANGELHPMGITLLGQGQVEVAYVGEGGNDGDPPELVRRPISDERLARLVALLEESNLRNALLDKDFVVEPDADRDLFFERAVLGVADRPHPKPVARSSYAFRGMREKYGLVRSRESILPFELVLQGSLDDLGLGAFPRIRRPKATPDAFLYR